MRCVSGLRRPNQHDVDKIVEAVRGRFAGSAAVIFAHCPPRSPAVINVAHLSRLSTCQAITKTSPRVERESERTVQPESNCTRLPDSVCIDSTKQLFSENEVFIVIHDTDANQKRGR